MHDRLDAGSTPSGPVADWAVAARRVPGGPEGIVELARLMAKECRPMLTALRAAAADGDAATATISAHKVQGAARYFGAHDVVRRASRLERLAGEGRLDEVAGGLDALEQAVERLARVLARVEADEVRRAIEAAKGGAP